MTVRKATRCGGFAAVIARHRLHNTSQQLDIVTITKPASLPVYNIVVGFNEKDQLQLLTKDEKSIDDKHKLNNYDDIKTSKCENIPIDDITNCVNVENYPNCENTLVFYVTKNYVKEAIALKFENDQDFKRIYFTYKYFKMRNRLTNNNNYSSSENIFAKKKNYHENIMKNRKNSIEEYHFSDKGRKIEFDLHTTDNNGVTHISVQKKGYKSRFDQPLSLIGIRSDMAEPGEIDSIIYTDVDIPAVSEKKRLFHRNKPKAPLPPTHNDNKVLKGEFVRVNVERIPDVIPKDNRVNKSPDIIVFRDTNKSKTRTSPTRNLWSTNINNNKVSTGYESDREEWRSSRSQFSTTAFDSLARPTKMAMALTLKKPQRLDPVPPYYRLNEPKKLSPPPFRPNNYLPRQPRLPRPSPDLKRNQLTTEHRKYTSLQNLDIPKKMNEQKKPVNEQKKNYSNLTNRLTGLTNKLRDLGATNTIGRFKAQSHNDVANLKPVLKTFPDSKRPVVRTCSAEPPKKVTFSAFATVQVV